MAVPLSLDPAVNTERFKEAAYRNLNQKK